jgi:hypothetical protein
MVLAGYMGYYRQLFHQDGKCPVALAARGSQPTTQATSPRPVPHHHPRVSQLVECKIPPRMLQLMDNSPAHLSQELELLGVQAVSLVCNLLEMLQCCLFASLRIRACIIFRHIKQVVLSDIVKHGCR